MVLCFYYNLVSIIPLLLLLPFNESINYTNNENSVVDKRILISQCPVANSNTEGVLEEFLTLSEWSSARQETNTDNLTTGQITLLTSPNHTSKCETFNNQYQEALSEEWESGGKTYDVTYYKAGDFYFVVILLKEPNDSNVAASGVNYLDVYDDNLNLVKGYAF
jgi:hypothetical protein